jgi:hypothetical protein
LDHLILILLKKRPLRHKYCCHRRCKLALILTAFSCAEHYLPLSLQ